MRDDINSNDEQQVDPADALANLARGDAGEIVVPDKADEVDPLSALDAMAKDDCDAVDPDEFAASETAAADVSDEVFAGGDSISRSSGREHVTVGAGYHRHHAHMYKKTMIPLMLLVGAMLVLVGLLASVKVLQAEPDDKILYKWYGQMKLVMYVSFPLAAVVLAGAWWFHRDVKK